MGGELFVHEIGEGSAVVLLHGAPSAAEDLLSLREHLPGFRLLAPELPGYGRSPRLSPYDLETAQRQVEDALLGRGIRQAAVVGFSGGVYRALGLALAGRIGVTRLVCLAGSPGYEPAQAEALRGFVGLLRPRQDFSDPALRQLYVSAMLSPGYLARHAEAGRRVAACLELTTPAVLADEMEAFAHAPDLRPRLGQLRMPVLARVGRLDATANGISGSEAIARGVGDGELSLVENAGHMLLVEDPEATGKAIAAFLRR